MAAISLARSAVWRQRQPWRTLAAAPHAALATAAHAHPRTESFADVRYAVARTADPAVATGR